jgi:hypothetical protein
MYAVINSAFGSCVGGKLVGNRLHLGISIRLGQLAFVSRVPQRRNLGLVKSVHDANVPRPGSCEVRDDRRRPFETFVTDAGETRPCQSEVIASVIGG